MKRLAKLTLFAMSAIIALPVASETRPVFEPRASAVLYRDRNFTGPAVAVEGARSDLGLSWPVRSIKIKSGLFEACSDSDFRGRCFRITGTDNDLPGPNRKFRSIRPVYSASNGWKVIGERNVADRKEIDIVPVWGSDRHEQIRICVGQNAVRFREVNVRFRNGEIQNVPILPLIGAGNCTRDIRLEGGPRDIATVDFNYETSSAGWESAEVRIFAR